MFSTAAMLGGHLLKAGVSKAFKWAKNNPEALGRGIGKLSKYAAKFSPKFGKVNNIIRKTAKVGTQLAPKSSYINKLSSSIRNNSSSTKKPLNDSSGSTSTKKFISSGYVGEL